MKPFDPLTDGFGTLSLVTTNDLAILYAYVPALKELVASELTCQHDVGEVALFGIGTHSSAPNMGCH